MNSFTDLINTTIKKLDIWYTRSHVVCDGIYDDTFVLIIDDKWYEV